MDDHLEPDDSTQKAERAEAEREHVADLPAEGAPDVEPADAAGVDMDGVADHEREMNRLGADVKGEGAVP